MSWNYRVVRRVFPGNVHLPDAPEEHQYAIHEVYYDEGGQPEFVTENSVAPSGETLEELQQDVTHYVQALTLPVLEYAQFEKKDA